MNVLSLFDGISGGQVALHRAGITVDNYYASEIDKYAIKITQKNFPNTVQLGDINNWREWNLPEIDLIIGGSPCQGFSISGTKLNFDDPRSKLFFVFVDILRFYKPKYVLLENVKMKKEWRDVITSYMELEPVLINSALVSAQNRERYYWTNIPNVSQPEDKHIYLKDIIESGTVDRDKSYCVDANYFKGGSEKTLKKNYYENSRRQIVQQSARRLQVKELPVALTERRTEEAKEIRRKVREETGKDFSPRRGKEVVARTDGKSNCLTTGMTIEHVVGVQCIQVGEATDINGHDIMKRVYSTEGKSPTVHTMGGGNREPKIAVDEIHWRKLTPLECERLQTFSDNYTEGVSNTQRYKALGNSFTVDVISHILKGIKNG